LFTGISPPVKHSSAPGTTGSFKTRSCRRRPRTARGALAGTRYRPMQEQGQVKECAPVPGRIVPAFCGAESATRLCLWLACLCQTRQACAAVSTFA
jgi:hypothetical protein